MKETCPHKIFHHEGIKVSQAAAGEVGIIAFRLKNLYLLGRAIE